MKLIPIQSEDARWHCRRRRKPSRTAALLCHRQGTNRGASGKGALVSGGCCTAAKMKGTQHPARKWPVRMWCWFWECELYVSLGGGGLLGFASLFQGALGAYRAVLVPARCLRLRLVVPTPETAQTPSKPPDGHPRARAPPQAFLLLLRQNHTAAASLSRLTHHHLGW